MGLMGSLYLGVSGLQTSNNALNTTAHNMSNLDTVGYTRQQVAQATRSYNTIGYNVNTGLKQTGLGVNYSETRQIRDYFLDLNYRRESGRAAFYDVSAAALMHIEDVLGESNEGEEFSTSLDELWVSIQELSKDPCNEVNQNLLINKCYEFMLKANAVYTSLQDYQNTLNETVKNDVYDINQCAEQIHTLNNKIVEIEAAGVEHANDLRDQRNALLDKLCTYGRVTYDEDEFGYVSVTFEGQDLVKGGLVSKMEIYEDPQTGFYTPYWDRLAAYEYKHVKEGNDWVSKKILTDEGLEASKVFNLDLKISSDLNTDIGSLKATILARGDHVASAKELDNYPPDADPSDPTQAVAGWYDNEISESIVMNIEAEFDQLVSKLTAKVNSVLSESAEKASLIDPNSTYLRDANGNPYQIFEKNIEEGEWKTDNIIVNMNLRQNPSLLTFRLPDGSEDNATMESLKTAFKEEIYRLNPNVQTPVAFADYYKNLVSQVANSGYVFNSIQESQTATVDSLKYSREEVLGVSSDEELSNMIMFQNAYNANSRFINVVDEMLEHLLNSMGY